MEGRFVKIIIYLESALNKLQNSTILIIFEKVDEIL